MLQLAGLLVLVFLSLSAPARADSWGSVATISAEPTAVYVCYTNANGKDITCDNKAPYVNASTGFVGIGTTSPLSALDIQTAITAASGSAKGVNVKQTLSAAANNDALTALYINPTFTDGALTGVTHNGLIVANGNVGIGTASPSTDLSFGGDATRTLGEMPIRCS